MDGDMRTEDVVVYQIDRGAGWEEIPLAELRRIVASLFIHPGTALQKIEEGEIAESPGFRFCKKEYRVTTHIPE